MTAHELKLKVGDKVKLPTNGCYPGIYTVVIIDVTTPVGKGRYWITDSDSECYIDNEPEITLATPLEQLL